MYCSFASTSLLERLETMGWQAEVRDIRQWNPEYKETTFAEEPAVVKACQKDLTERSTSMTPTISAHLISHVISVIQNLLPALEEYMRGYREERLVRDRKRLLLDRLPLFHEVVKTYRMSVPPDAIAIDVADFFYHPEILNFIINTPDISGPADLDPIRPRLPEIAQELQVQLTDQLLALISADAEAKYVFDPATVLDLATTTFACATCLRKASYQSASPPDVIRYPRVLAHECAVRIEWPKSEVVDFYMLEKVTYRTSWNRLGLINFDMESRAILADVVEMCGLDPATTTAAEMDAADPIIECLACNNLHFGRCIMRWDLVVWLVISLTGRHRSSWIALLCYSLTISTRCTRNISMGEI